MLALKLRRASFSMLSASSCAMENGHGKMRNRKKKKKKKRSRGDGEGAAELSIALFLEIIADPRYSVLTNNYDEPLFCTTICMVKDRTKGMVKTQQ